MPQPMKINYIKERQYYLETIRVIDSSNVNDGIDIFLSTDGKNGKASKKIEFI